MSQFLEIQFYFGVIILNMQGKDNIIFGRSAMLSRVLLS